MPRRDSNRNWIDLRGEGHKNELYFLNDLKKSIIEIFETDSDFERFIGNISRYIETPVTINDSHIQFFLPDGQNVVGGKNICELIEMELYTGRIHSTNTATPSSNHYLLSQAHESVRRHVTFTLASASLKIAQNILQMRDHILRLAKIKNNVKIFPELEEFSKKLENDNV